MKIYDLIVEGYPDTIAAFNKAADPTQVKTAIDQYRELVNRNQVQGNERNIDWWRTQGWDKFSEFVQSKSTLATKTQVKRKRAVGKSITIKETPEWLVVIPMNHDASCFHGRGSDWCTARPQSHYFDHYFLDRDVVLIYCINKTTGDKYALATHRDISEIEMFDKADNPITEFNFKDATGFSPTELARLIPHDDERIQDVKTARRQQMRKILDLIQTWSLDPQPGPEIEQKIIDTKNTDIAAYYVIKLGKERRMGGEYYDYRIKFPEALAMMAVRSEYALDTLFDDLDLSIEDNPIAYMKDPSDAVKLASVKTDGYSIRGIANPSEEIQLAAVSQNGYAVGEIKNPSPAVQLAAVNKTPGAIRRIQKPTKSAIELAKSHGYIP